MARPPEPRAGAVPFTEAIEFLRRRLLVTSADWRALWAHAGAAAESAADDVAEAVQRDLLKAVSDLVEAGGTLEDFRRDYGRILNETGWAPSGKGGWHSRLVWRLHTQTAYAAGRWEQAQRLQAARPGEALYARYVTAGDHRVRPQHKAWHGIVLPLDHRFWHTHWPPNGFNCRCHVILVRDRDLRRYRWSVTPDTDPRLAIPPDPGWANNAGMVAGRLTVPAPATPVIDISALMQLVNQATTLPPRTALPAAIVPDELVATLRLSARELMLSAETVASHLKHGVSAAEYAALPAALLEDGEIVADSRRIWSFTVYGRHEGALWLMALKVDRGGIARINSLHRTRWQQIRTRGNRGTIIRSGKNLG